MPRAHPPVRTRRSSLFTVSLSIPQGIEGSNAAAVGGPAAGYDHQGDFPGGPSGVSPEQGDFSWPKPLNPRAFCLAGGPSDPMSPEPALPGGKAREGMPGA